MNRRWTVLRGRYRRYRKQTVDWWMNLDPWTRALPRYLGRAFANFFQHGLNRAAALAYYAIFSIFPLVLLLAVIIGGVLGPAIASEQIIGGLALFVPEQSIDLFQTSVTDVLRQGQSFGLIAVVGLVWSGLGLFSNITAALDFIFQVPSGRSIWRLRLVGFGMALILVVLITSSFVTSAALRLVSALLLDRPNNWLSAATIFLPLGIDMLIFALLFRFVPARQVHWDAVWTASIFGAVGWEILKEGFNWYINTLANFQFVYGSIATVIVLLFWAYLIASIFLLSAEVCAQLNIWFADRDREEEERRFLESETLAELQAGRVGE